MPDHTPADKPDLPALPALPISVNDVSVNGAWSSFEMAQYGRQCADDREAWARADERRKALEEAARIADGYPGAHSDDIARDIRALIDRKEPTT